MKTKVFAVILLTGILTLFFVSCGSTTTAKTEKETEQTTEASASEEPQTQASGTTTGGSETETALVTQTTATAFPGEYETVVGIYRGILGYGEIQAAAVKEGQTNLYRFDCGSGGVEKVFSVRTDEAYTLQNRLMEGYAYVLHLEEGEIVDAFLIDSPEQTSPVFAYEPGKTTLKNFLLASLAPMGNTLYIYGGGWDWQDAGSSVQSKTIGLPGEWKAFYESQTADYLYKDEDHPAASYYPFGGWNEYYYAGLDCSGYLGWVFYNTVNTESNVGSGYVGSSTKFAKKLAEEYGYGTFRHDFENGRLPLSELHAGDVISISGHVYICLGLCNDGSAVIIHSTVGESVSGKKGGGVQLSVLSSDDSKDCDAYRLVSEFTNTYYPGWRKRYDVEVKPLDTYTNIPADNANTGVFTFLLGEVFTDPDGYAAMTAEEILADISKK